MLTRRSLFGLLAGLPFVGSWFRRGTAINRHDECIAGSFDDHSAVVVSKDVDGWFILEQNVGSAMFSMRYKFVWDENWREQPQAHYGVRGPPDDDGPLLLIHWLKREAVLD